MEKPFVRALASGMKKLARSLARQLGGVRPLPGLQPRTTGSAPPLRYGIIGLGVMGRTHAAVLRGRPGGSLVAVTSRSAEKRAVATEFGCRWFDSVDEMIRGGDVNAVVIATPHWHHAETAVAALRVGLHVVCEKPLAVTVTQTDAVLRAAAESDGVLSVVLQSRYEPAYQYAKTLLAGGELGPVVRCEVVETNFRTRAYYRSNPWRGTWAGEGGGVLVNQAPHVFDRYLWLCGVPAEVAGFCATALHEIEVEDSASAVFQHPGGEQGFLHVSTNECPGVSRVVVSCDRGRVTIGRGSVVVEWLAESIRERAEAGTAAFTDIPARVEHLAGPSFAWSPELLERFYDDFERAAAVPAPPPVDPADAARAVELANAVALASAGRRAVRLPLDRGEVDAFFAGKLNRPAPGE